MHSSPGAEPHAFAGGCPSQPLRLKRRAGHAPYPAPLVGSGKATRIKPVTDGGLRSVEQLGDLRNGEIVAVYRLPAQRLQLHFQPVARYNDRTSDGDCFSQFAEPI